MRVLTVIKYVFLVVGLAQLVGAYLWYDKTQSFLKDSVSVKGTVVALVQSTSSDSTTYRPVVEFKTQAGTIVEFTSTMGSSPPSHTVGETVEVFYHQSTPEQAKINSFISLWVAPAIIGGMGSIFFLIGFSFFLFSYQKGKKIERLKISGVPIKANIQSVARNRSVTVGGKHPFQIAAQWMNPKTSKLHVFTSENIWFDPTDYIQGDEIKVLIERDNPKRYHVDTSFLPELAD